MINIDENEDTIHTKAGFDKILQRGKRLQSRMDEAMGDDAWEKLHGPNEIPKRYVPPFLQDNNAAANKKSEDFKKREEERMENLYSIEIEAGLNRGGNRQQDGLHRGAPS